MRGRPLAVSTLLILGTIAAGLTIRLAPLGLPYAIVKYGGSLLWALMIYWIVSAVRARWPLTRCALLSSAIALCVELFKLYHAPLLDAVRSTLPGKLLLGRVFSPWDLVAYAVAIMAGVLTDRAVRSSMWRPAPFHNRCQARSRASTKLTSSARSEASGRDLQVTIQED